MDQPRNALDMITRFTRREDFGGRASTGLMAAVSAHQEALSSA